MRPGRALKNTRTESIIGAMETTAPYRRSRYAFFALATLLCAAYVLHLLGAGLPALDAVMERWGGLVVEIAGVAACAARAILVRSERRIWALFAAGAALWMLGDLYFRSILWTLEEYPIPSPADVGWLLFYLPIYAAIVMLLRSRVTRSSASVWVDGIIGGLAVAAITAAIVIDAVLDSIGGDAGTVVTGLAYPVFDMVLIALVLGALNMQGWRKDATWLWIGASLSTFAVADAVYLVQTAKETYVAGSIVDAGWCIALLMLGWAAWRPARAPVTVSTGEWRTISLPILFGSVSLGILVYDHFVRVNVLALILSTACIAAVLCRLALTYAQNIRMLTRSREEATTDSLTALGNRRKLLLDLDRGVDELAEGRPLTLVLFDLNGFKLYNDSFGHPAGDSLLARLGSRLAAAMEGSALAYRVGGDEFCVLADKPTAEGAMIAAKAAAALKEEGDGFSVSASYGSVVLPDETRDAMEALRIADQRMYAQKDSSRTSAGRQSTDVLLQALAERHSDLGAHLGQVADLAVATAAKLHLPDDEVEQIRVAAELHDVGKVAIPDAILDKAEPLNDEEWQFIRRHSEIGERIVAAAPALAPVARLVRFVHERWDGGGYPDGLVREEIPLGARIVAVCDAFDAMTSDRSYRCAMPVAHALAELRRCAATQFDPDVVEAFCVAHLDMHADAERQLT